MTSGCGRSSSARTTPRSELRPNEARCYSISQLINGQNCGLRPTMYAKRPALDQRALYHERVGIEATRSKVQHVRTISSGKNGTIRALPCLKDIESLSQKHLGAKADLKSWLWTNHLKDLTTEQSEIIATLYACWNDPSDKKFNRMTTRSWTTFLKNGTKKGSLSLETGSFRHSSGCVNIVYPLMTRQSYWR